MSDCASTPHGFCPVYDSIDVLQEKWNLHIIRALLEGPKGFNELSRAVGGVNTTTLTTRLERLELLGLVVREVQSTMPPRTSYTLSEAGVALKQVIDAIHDWAIAYMPQCKETSLTKTAERAS